MHESFGARLRQRREERQVSLAAIAEQTKIKASLLQSLEEDDVSHWPSGIFRRAFIRAYAHAIGLDPDITVREFLEVHPDPSEAFETPQAIALAADRARGNEPPPPTLFELAASAIAFLGRLRRSPAGPDRQEDAAARRIARGPGEFQKDAVPETVTGPDAIQDANEGRVWDEVDTAAPPACDPSMELEAAVAGGFDEASDTMAGLFPAAPDSLGADPLPSQYPDPGEAERATMETACGDEPGHERHTSDHEAPGRESEEVLTMHLAEQREPEPAPASLPIPRDPDLQAVASLCTELGRAEKTFEVPPLLEQAARLLDAKGVIVWIWDARAGQLRPALAHGYSDWVLAQLPTVTRDADNATAAAFRLGRTCVVAGSEEVSGALVVPMMTAAGCAGVLAIELQHGHEQLESVRAVATILTAMLAQLVAGVGSLGARSMSEPIVSARGNVVGRRNRFRPPVTRYEARARL